MTTPARSPIADAAAKALKAHESSAAVQQEARAAARAAVAPLIPGAPVQSLEVILEPEAGLAIVTDGVVHLGVRSDGIVCVVEQDGPEWTEKARVASPVELARALPPAMMHGRR